MKKLARIAITLSIGLSIDVGAQDPKSVIDDAQRAMGTASLQAIRYSATGWVYAVGQAPGPGKPWPRFQVANYEAAIDYTVPIMREELVRVDVENPPRGGGAGPYIPATGQGGIRPIPFGSQTQVQTRDARNEVGLLQIWITPHGFLKAAAANNATVTSGSAGGKTVRTISFTVNEKYTVTGAINDQHLVERVETRVPNTLLGDMLLETRYSDYKDVGGVKVPMRVLQRQGGFPTLDLTISHVQPNSATALQLTSPAGPPAAAPGAAANPETKAIAEGVWLVGGGSPNSHLVEFADHMVVIEAPQNDEYTTRVIAEAKRLAPNKPVRSLINSHHHSDHSGGLRGYAAEGITIITHELNKPYYEKIFTNPFQLNPDRLARANRKAVIETVGDKRVLTDGLRTLEIYHVRGNLHDEGLLIVYLPKEKLLVQADAYGPRPPDGRPLLAPSPYTINLIENIERLKLDVAQVVHIHGGVDPYAVVKKAAGREGTPQ